HHHRRIGRGGDAAGDEGHDGQSAEAGDLPDQVVRGSDLLGCDVELVFALRAQCADLGVDGAQMAHRLGDVAGACFALRTDHRGAFGDAAKSLAEVGRTTDERHLEDGLVDVVDVVGGGEDLGFVDVVDAEGLKNLCFDEVSDAGLGHNGDGYGADDRVDEIGIAHPGDSALGTDVGGDAFEGHHGGG